MSLREPGKNQSKNNNNNTERGRLVMSYFGQKCTTPAKFLVFEAGVAQQCPSAKSRLCRSICTGIIACVHFKSRR
jgi:hypothetical protein